MAAVLSAIRPQTMQTFCLVVSSLAVIAVFGRQRLVSCTWRFFAVGMGTKTGCCDMRIM